MEARNVIELAAFLMGEDDMVEIVQAGIFGEDGYTIQAVKEAVLQKVIEFERRKFNELDSGDYICEQLDDWNFAFTPNGTLLCDGKVTMTKYAVIVRREAEK